MRALLPAIALCAGLHAAAAAQPADDTAPAITAAGQGELHAQLVTPADGLATSQRHNEPVVVVATNLQPAPARAHASGSSEERRPTTAAMLLAALALMTGIALRRWGSSQQ